VTIQKNNKKTPGLLRDARNDGSTPTLSVILITKNSARTLTPCLESIKSIAHEIIVLDSGSTDDTLTIAKRFTEQVYSTDWPGFGPQKQRALDKAKSDWVLSLDSDEVLSPECQQEIRATLAAPQYLAYRIPRVMIFAGRKLHHSGCADAPLRLFKRGTAKFNDKLVHESLITEHPVGMLRAALWHYSYADLGDWIAKMNLYSDLEYQQKTQPSGSVSKAVMAGFVAFIKMYFLKKGFLDGRLGFVASVNSAVASYYKYLKRALNPQFSLSSD